MAGDSVGLEVDHESMYTVEDRLGPCSKEWCSNPEHVITEKGHILRWHRGWYPASGPGKDTMAWTSLPMKELLLCLFMEVGTQSPSLAASQIGDV